MQIKATSKTNSVRALGDFKVESGAMRFTDPCYKNDTWCKGSMPAVNGTYNARIGFFRDSYDEKSMQEALSQANLAIQILSEIDYAQYAKYERIKEALDAADYRKNGGKDILYEDIAFDDDLKPTLALLEKHIVDTIGAQKSEWQVHGKWLKMEIDDLVCFVLAEKYHHVLNTHENNYGHLMAMEQIRTKTPEGTSAEDYLRVRFELYNPITIKYLKLCAESRQKSFDEGKPQRTHFLHIKHESLPEFTSFDSEDWQYNNKFDVGVDSGQAGFFDEQWFTIYANTQESNEDAWNETYNSLCALSSGGDNYRNSNDPTKQEGGAFEFGANSYTAHGDGSAPMFYITNEKGEVLEAVYHYDVDCEECEDEEDQAA